ncbi:2-polyprenyl-6-methoxyphenol hydroxylase-like FAD-dependent oxidoreductase [Krasilnikovia cinnamomea]|uniref:2-polyprenyl-6-methoxyphenol hydroxylase-like FAD-dependent oxidoreductase n=1 Tax=Krasilnikovia cinnamomea TaxID=349313 RepID=A0A4Q7ZT42_9ACTN|nr:NAD(P)/FAD-dependent oxidoreductase [Krasilnikovia cinnamomea]RZU54372.1 2-polyprenyl-6-methoxyphenol hydroxylase-like FAD-dependent oxidoreductase [Krasilnikovia cinnamomea]
MAGNVWDVIVVGARCAGSPVAMLLAARGHRVLLVDRSTFPSDTVSTHVIHPPGVAALRGWGLLDRVTATGCPPIDTYAFDFGAVRLSGAPGTAESPVAYAPRRRILDQVLVEAAAAAGAQVRTAFTVDELIIADGRVAGVRGHTRGGAPVEERARVVVGADGQHSLVAQRVGAPASHERAPMTVGYYSYWSGLEMHGRFEAYARDGRGFAAAPTNDGLTLVIGGWPYAEFAANRGDVEGHLRKTFELAPEFAQRIGAARREERIVGASVSGYLRKPYGPGWALVGDAGYNRDFITAQGISDAFRDAQSCADALHAALAGERDFDSALAGYHTARDRHVLPMYELTAQLAALEPPPPPLAQLLAAMQGNQAAMDAFARVNAGVTPAPEFFAEDNVARIFAAAGGG